jgi:hypothetical protein
MDEDSSRKPLSPSDRLRQQFERKTKEKQKLIDERAVQILDARGDEILKRVAAHGVDEDISNKAVGLVAEQLAENSLHVQNFDAKRTGGTLDERLVTEGIAGAYEQAKQHGQDTQSGAQAVASPPSEFEKPSWKAQAETAERQRGQNQRYDELKTHDASTSQGEGKEAGRQDHRQHGQPFVPADPQQPADMDKSTTDQITTDKTSSKTGDRAAALEAARQLQGDEKKKALQEFSRMFGREVNEQEGKEATQTLGKGGGQSL